MHHFLGIDDWPVEALHSLLALAADIKRAPATSAGQLQGKQLALVFQKPSLRTRVSFEVAASQLGVNALRIGPEEIGLGERESVPDVARLLSRMVDAIMARVFTHSDLVQMAQWATVPVINGLSDWQHPCQALADVLTIQEKCGGIQGVRVAYVGDANNVARSLGQAVVRLGGQFVIASPAGYSFDADTRAALFADAAASGGSFEVMDDPREGVRGAQVVYTDTWVSMGQEAETAARLDAFAGFQVNASLLEASGGSPWVMHCLPAHRGYEISDDVADGSRSIIFDQAENRLFVQKAVLIRLLS